jgi:hypothetical protein
MVHDLSQKQFTAKDVYRILDIDKNRLFHWINTHRLLEPDIEEGGGRGNKRVFSVKNLVELAIVYQLHQYGIELRMVREVKKLIDTMYIRAKSENGKWIPVFEDYVGKTRKFNIYDWVFETERETFIRLYYRLDGETIVLNAVTGHELEEKDKEEVKRHLCYLTINITRIAALILSRAM